MEDMTPRDTAQPVRKLGQLLGDAKRLVTAHWREYAMLVLAATLPAYLVKEMGAFVTGLPDDEAIKAAMTAGRWGAVAVVTVTGLINAFLQWMCYIGLVAAAAVGETQGSIDVQEIYGFALKRLVSSLWTGFLVLVGVILGLVLLIIPGVLMAIFSMFAPLAVVLEGLSGVPAIQRSREVIRGNVGKAFGNLFVAGLVAAGVVIVAVIPLAIVTFVIRAILPMAVAGLFSVALGYGLLFVFGMIQAWVTAVTVMLYRDLSAAKSA